MMKSSMARLMFTAAAAFSLGLAALGTAAQPVEVQGVKFEPTAQVGAATLQLNGAGVRTKVFFKVYAAGLYVPKKSTDAAALLAQTGARRIAITMLRDVDGETFAGALIDGLRANHSEAQLAGWKAQMDALNASVKAAGEARKGDLLHFEFIPDAGTRLTVGGQARGSVIPGEDFFTALLRIWIGDKPVDASLKKGMLGG